jgi:hypothetical protein
MLLVLNKCDPIVNENNKIITKCATDQNSRGRETLWSLEIFVIERQKMENNDNYFIPH